MSGLYVETRGPADGPDLLLVHGWAMHGGLWGPLVDHLAERFRVHVVDLPGHGLSAGAVPEAEVDAWARALLAVAPPRAIWVAWSLGGLIAQAAALLVPERVVALALLASTPSFVTRDGWPHAVAPAAFQGFAGSMRQDPEATLAKFMALQVRGAARATATLRALRAALNTRPPASQQGLEEGLALLLDTDLRARIGALRMPLAAIYGERDTLIPAASAQALLALTPNARVDILPGAGHAPFWSHPDAVCAILDGLFDDAI